MARIFLCSLLFFTLTARAGESAKAERKSAGASFADNVILPSSWKTYRDEKLKLSLQYPTKWKTQPASKAGAGPSPILVTFTKPDQSASVTILQAKESKFSALDFLNQMDQTRKATNQIPETQRILDAEALKKTGGLEGAIGFYEIPGKRPLLQRAMILRTKKAVLIVTGTFQKDLELDDDPLVESILTSVQLQP